MSTYVVLGLALAAMTFFGVCDPSGQLSGPTGSAAEVANETISRTEFQRAYQETYRRYQQQLSDNFDPARMKLANNVMNQLINERVMYVTAVNMGLKASDAEVMEVLADAEVFKDEEGKFSSENFDNFLRGNGFTEASFMRQQRRYLTTFKFRRFITEMPYVSKKAAELDYKMQETKLDIEYVKVDTSEIKIDVSDADVKAFAADEANKTKIEAFYNENKLDYDKPARVKARHILVSFDGARNATAEAKKRSKDDAQKRAADLYAKASADGADFEKLAKENTDEAVGKNTGGDLGWFTKDQMVKEFSDAAFAMNVGDVKGPVESTFGFHIIKVENKEEAKKIEMADATNEIARKILEKEKRPEMAKAKAEEVMAAAKEGGDVDAALKKHGLEWKATGDVSLTARSFPGIGSATEVRDAIMTLQEKGQLYDGVLDVRGDYVVMRLKDLKSPDMQKFDDEQHEQLARSTGFSRGFQLYNSLEKSVRDRFDEQKQIRINPEYLALDNPDRQQTTGG